MGAHSRFWFDIPDILEGMLATGARLGEMLALNGDDIDAPEQAVTFRHHIVRVRGEGLVRVPGRKGKKPVLTLGVPEWSISMWRRRKLTAGAKSPVFPSARGYAA